MNPSGRDSSLPCGHGDLGQGTQHDSLLEADKGNEGRVQEVHLPNENVGSFRVTRQFFHEFILQLHGKGQEKIIYFRREE